MSSLTKVAVFVLMLAALLLLAVVSLVGVFIYRRSASPPNTSVLLPQAKARSSKRQRRKIVGSQDSGNEATRSSEPSGDPEAESKAQDTATEIQPVSDQDDVPLDPSLCGTCREKQWKRECIQQLCRPCCRTSKPRLCDVHTDHIEKMEVRSHLCVLCRDT